MVDAEWSTSGAVCTASVTTLDATRTTRSINCAKRLAGGGSANHFCAITLLISRVNLETSSGSF